MYRAPVYDEYWEYLLNPTHRDLYLLPRGSYKTTCLQAHAMRSIIANPNIRILYCCDTYAQSKQSLGWVKRQFEQNQELKEQFGNFVGERGWRDEYLWVKGRTDLSKKEPTFTAAGVDRNITGGHYEKIYLDDMVTLQNSRTKHGLETTIEWLKALLYVAEDVVDPATGQITHRTEILGNGTRYSDQDMYGWIIRLTAELEKLNKKGGWRLFVKSADPRDNSGAYIFPHLTQEVLDEKRAGGAAGYNAQMRQNPVPSEFALFRREDFRLVPRHDLPRKEEMYFYMLVDTATTENREDFTCLTVIAKDALKNVYVMDMLLGQWKPSDVVSNIFSLYRKWPCRKMTMEKIAANEVYSAMIESESIVRQIPIRIESIFGRTRESKELRIQSLEGAFHARKIFFSAELAKFLIRVEAGMCYGEIVDQFLRFPKGAHDDIPDCLSDVNKTDRNNAPICPAPSLRLIQRIRARKGPGTVNGRCAAQPTVGQPQRNNYWGDLRKQVGG